MLRQINGKYTEQRFMNNNIGKGDAWFIREVEKSGRTSLTPANNMITLASLIVLLATISTAIGAMSLVMAQQYALALAPGAVAACLIAFIGWALTKKTAG
uniref:Uncharacterized protein n=2 Tax=Aquisalinus luteolus TaxID=1566827 RepID=A0A8J3A3X9_9PROT|nr:hypothetical protein GCM10011355_21270 [Aquisalinus luteolus]